MIKGPQRNPPRMEQRTEPGNGQMRTEESPGKKGSLPTTQMKIDQRNHLRMEVVVVREGDPRMEDPQMMMTRMTMMSRKIQTKVQRPLVLLLIQVPEGTQEDDERRIEKRGLSGNAKGVGANPTKQGAGAAPRGRKHVDFASGLLMTSDYVLSDKMHPTVPSVINEYMKTPRSAQYGWKESA